MEHDLISSQVEASGFGEMAHGGWVDMNINEAEHSFTPGANVEIGYLGRHPYDVPVMPQYVDEIFTMEENKSIRPSYEPKPRIW